MYQLVSGGFPFGATCSESQTEKFSFIATANLKVLAVHWSVKYPFAPNFSIFRKSAAEEQQQDRQLQRAIRFK